MLAFPWNTSVTLQDAAPATALWQSRDERSLAAIVYREPEHPATVLVSEGTAFIEQVGAVLPLDSDADADFAEYKKTLVRRIPRRVLTRK